MSSSNNFHACNKYGNSHRGMSKESLLANEMDLVSEDGSFRALKELPTDNDELCRELDPHGMPWAGAAQVQPCVIEA